MGRCLIALSACFLVAACAAEDGEATVVPGLSNPSSDPQPGALAPVEESNESAVTSRGRLLWDMERALRIGYDEGLSRVGDRGSHVVLPVAEVDAGGRSGQVVFYRWKPIDIADSEHLDPAKAQKFLLVSVMLWPDRVIDVEQITGYVAKDSRDFHRIAALLAAAKQATSTAVDIEFHAHAIFEELAADGRRESERLQSRVYLFAQDDQGPDLEIVVQGPQARGLPRVLSTTLRHEAGARRSDVIRTAASVVTPMTVARVLMRGPEAGEVPVSTASGGVLVSATDGRITRPAQ